MTRILLDSVPSTNDYALELVARRRPPERTVVQALEQTRGKGQAGAQWSSERGKNITLSMILYPVFLVPSAQFRLTQAVALAVADVVALHVGETRSRIKWPNDVMLDGLKVAGILIESRIDAARVDVAVAGIGLNVNQTVFPPELTGASSLGLARGRVLDLDAVVEALDDRLARRYHELQVSPATTEQAYHARLWGMGEPRVFQTPGGPITGTVTGVDAEGRLAVRGEDGQTRRYGTREISWGR